MQLIVKCPWSRPPVNTRPSRHWAGRRRALQISRERPGGARLGCSGSTAPVARPRCPRIRSMSAGCSMQAMTRSRPPHCRQVSMSMANTRLRRCAQVIARCGLMVDGSWCSLPAAARVLGTTRDRSGLAGANTPWYRVRCARGFGTSAARRAIKSSGVDLHRNLSQKWPFLASKTDPSAVSQIFEMAAIRFV